MKFTKIWSFSTSNRFTEKFKILCIATKRYLKVSPRQRTNLKSRTMSQKKCTIFYLRCQKPPKGGVGFAWKNYSVSPPPVTALTSKCHNFFSIESLSSLEMYVRQKFSLCLFPKFFLILSVSHHFCLVFGQKTLFLA